MRAAIVEERRRVAIRELQDPIPKREEVLIKVQYCGICGSDLHIYLEGLRTSLGHELSGDIAAMGEEVEGFAIGEPVVIAPHGCGTCYWCHQGEVGLCDRLFVSTTERKVGGFATYVKAKSDHLLHLPEGVTYEMGTLIEPTAIAVHAVNLAGIQKAEVVAVLGLGPIGQLVTRIARLQAKAVYATEISETRRDLAKRVVDEVINPTATDPVERILDLTDGVGADVVFECAGTDATTQEAIAVARKRGTIVIPGMCFEAVETSFIDVVLKELTIKGSLNKNMNDFLSAMDLISNRTVEVSPLLTERFPLDEINEAFESALKGDGGKILVKP
jgi:2-desacetyl-2-hydroxyethyl bacteriochlorophyllide A dehydrogenase